MINPLSDSENEFAIALNDVIVNIKAIETEKGLHHLEIAASRDAAEFLDLWWSVFMKNKSILSLLKIIVAFVSLIAFSLPANAVQDGAYAGFYKVTFALPDTGERKGDTGEVIFVIQDNEIVDVQYSDEGFVKGKVKYKLKINEKTGQLKGYFTERNRREGGNVVSLRWQMKGVFVDQYFAGNASVYVTQYNGQTPDGGMIKVGTYTFESP